MKRYSIIVIGAGSAGLVIAFGAAKAGKKVLLIERGRFGGDCTNFGCIPSKSLIASSHVAHAIRDAETFGIHLQSHQMDTEGAFSRVRRIRQELRSHEDPIALRKAGIDVLVGTAQFKDPHTLIVPEENQTVAGRRIVIAAGSSPFIPEISGLKETPFLTNESIFELSEAPETLAILGAGPIGCEMAQAFQRLGSQVLLIHRHEQLLAKEESEAQVLLAEQFEKEGIQSYLGYDTESVQFKNDQFHLHFKNKSQKIISAQKLLVSVGRRPNVGNLNLENAGIHFSKDGIPVDAYGRTNQKHIWAIGDVTGPPLFTHAAENQARTVLTSLLLPFKKKLDRAQSVPRVTYTDPEIASVGLIEKDARAKYPDSQLAVYFVPLKENDRAVTASRTEGHVKIITKKWSSQILGATLSAPRAGEMLMQISLAMQAKIPLRKLASLIHPYPGFSQAIRKAADLWLFQTVLPGIKGIFSRGKK